MPEDELTALLTLNRIEGLGCIGAKLLYERFGSAQEIFRSRDHLKELIPGVSRKLIEALEDSGYSSSVREELDFIEKHGIRCITPSDSDYPVRLRDCHDAPLLLFMLGNANLNAAKIVSIVGTRKATDYGRRMCSTFVEELYRICPDVVVVSGLALGIDIEAHKASLSAGCFTWAVLAHGLDQIYPPSHRNIAKSILDRGALITEFTGQTQPFKANFVKRNRIIAGLADAVVVVESRAKGGSLITAEIAESYNRDCFAFPGSVGDPCSVGCNELIRENRAALITSATDFVNAMGWSCDSDNTPLQKTLPFALTDDEQRVFERIGLKAHGVHINTIIVDCNIPYTKLMTVLFSLEMKGLIKTSPGALYKLS
ncbi:MAG TPA: DNA-protecting protein DprA [Bacteroidales bacterium]|mgnify:FL=1|jgi:DNA processing protein|nr:DNA-protecting protein DprA [Bacteroidales bacterium]HBA13239.1 DNA-protecting protein DprA [Bacteroidales bacterium]